MPDVVPWTRRALLGAAAALTAMPRRAWGAEPWRVGMTAAMTGPASALGGGMRAGIEGAFTELNAAGGVHGRPLELIALDDGYKPLTASANMRRLIDEEGVFAILGNTGTPTAAVTVPIANEAKVPLFGAFTGAGLLRRTPPDRYILNYRASYAQETGEMVRALTRDVGIAPEHIGFFTQDDAYGDSGYRGAIGALQRAGFARAEELPHGRYARNTRDVEGGLARLMDPRNDVRAVIMVGAYGPCGRAVELGRQHGFRPIFANVSFVGSDALAKQLGREGDGVVVTQVVPHPRSDLPLTRRFREAVPVDQQSFVSLEGYIVGLTFARGLELAGPDADREAWIDALTGGADLDPGVGAPMRLSASRHQLSDQIWPTVIANGDVVALESWKRLRSRS